MIYLFNQEKFVLHYYLFKIINIIIVKIILKGFYFRLLQRTGKVINNINSFGK